ncbi:MAG: amidohydrolase family protein [Chloroflexi bacterium]|nr:amidohydrolase family protein [Chloroflexota bacterium]
MIIDGMMHLEVVGQYWDGLLEEVLEHYDAAGIDKGVVLNTWMPSRESNDRTMAACTQYPDRFVPFGHVRPVDDWQSELTRMTQEFGWIGLKLHQGELRHGQPDMLTATRDIVARAGELGIRLVKIHLANYEAVDSLAQEFPQLTWILPHMGCYFHGQEMQRYCELARTRPNVYLDTSTTDRYADLDRAVRWAGADKITFASDGALFSPLVEKSKIDTLRLPTPHRVPRLTDDEYAMIMGGTMARLLGLH